MPSPTVHRKIHQPADANARKAMVPRSKPSVTRREALSKPANATRCSGSRRDKAGVGEDFHFDRNASGGGFARRGSSRLLRHSQCHRRGRGRASAR